MLYYKFCKLSDFSSIEINKTYALLSGQQQSYINSLTETKRQQSICVRTLLNLMLLEHFEDLDVSKLSSDENSKPFLPDNSLHISFTHSDNCVGCAISNKPVGIDIEKVKPVKDSVINRVCSQDEIAFIKEYSDFFTLWTLKEAYIKATGNRKLKFKEINFISGNELQKDHCCMLTGETDGYKWSIIELI